MTRMKSALTLLLIVLPAALAVFLPASAAAAPAPAEIDTDTLDAFIRGQMARHSLPGLALAITVGDEVVVSRGYGQAGRGLPMTADTPLFIGSLAKSFTALAVMQLADEGKVELDAPARTYLPWFTVADEQVAAAISVRDLLQHTSGLSDLGYLPAHGDNLSIQDGAHALASARPTGTPGRTFQYFNANYGVLGAIIEATSGMAYQDYIQARIFDPLGMRNSYHNPRDAHAAGLAQGYGSLFSFSLPRPQPYFAYDLPAGFLMMSVNDLSRYLRVQLHGGQFGGARVLSPSGVAAMHTPTGASGVPYAMGWRVSEQFGYQVIGHGGSNENFLTEAMLIPELDMTIAILINKNSLLHALYASPQISDGVLAIAAGQPAPSGGLPMRLVGLAMLAGFCINMVFNLRALFNLKTWHERWQAMKPLARLWDVAGHFIIPAALALLVPLAMRAWLRRGFTLRLAFSMMPDGILWLALGMLLDIIQGCAKLALLRRGRGERALIQ